MRINKLFVLILLSFAIVHVNGCRRQACYVNCIYQGIGHEVAAEGGRSPDATEEFS